MSSLIREVGVPALVTVIILGGCEPVQGGPPSMSEVQAHLDLAIGYLPEGCDPVGLDGDGRGSMVGVAFACPEDVALRIEHLQAEAAGEAPATPTEIRPGWIEWRDEATGDVIRVVSADTEVELLLRVARSIEAGG